MYLKITLDFSIEYPHLTIFKISIINSIQFAYSQGIEIPISTFVSIDINIWLTYILLWLLFFWLWLYDDRFMLFIFYVGKYALTMLYFQLLVLRVGLLLFIGFLDAFVFVLTHLYLINNLNTYTNIIYITNPKPDLHILLTYSLNLLITFLLACYDSYSNYLSSYIWVSCFYLRSCRTALLFATCICCSM